MQVNFSQWLPNLDNLIFSNGSKNVPNVVEMAIFRKIKTSSFASTLRFYTLRRFSLVNAPPNGYIFQTKSLKLLANRGCACTRMQWLLNLSLYSL